MSSTTSSNKRHSILPPVSQAGPKAPVRLSSSLTISDSAILTGIHTITLRTESLVHPRAKIESQTGPVDIGRRCVVHERTQIGAAPSLAGSVPPSPSAGGDTGVTISDYCTIQVGAVIEAGGTLIKEGTVIGVGSRIGKGAVIGEVCLAHPSLHFKEATLAYDDVRVQYCTITPRTVIPAGATIDDYTVVFSQGLQRRDKRDVKDIRKRQQLRQLEVQQRLIPSNPAKFA